MARNRGIFNFSANLEVKKNAPLDSRVVVDTLIELTETSTWADSNNKVWLYDGIVVSVRENHGLYMLTNYDAVTAPTAYTDSNNWVAVDASAAKTDVTDNLISTSTTSALSANQGRVLKENIDKLKTSLSAVYIYKGSVDTYDDLPTDAAAAAEAAKTLANQKVASVAATEGSAIEVTGTATAPTVGLKLDKTPGNVTLSQSAAGLKASVVIPAATVTGVATGDKVLGLSGTKLSSTLNLKYDSTSKTIQLLGINDAKIAEIDATDFIKDGMVDDVSFDATSKNLTITFNTVSGKEAIQVDLSSLVDIYTAGNGIAIDKNVVSVKRDTNSEGFLSVGTAGVKLSGVQTAINTAKNAVIGYDADTATSNTIYGAKKYADSLAKNYATALQGGKADTALQSITKGTDGSYVTTTVGAKSSNSQSIATKVTVQAISTASSTAKGLAEASDVKTYVDALFAWEEL